VAGWHSDFKYLCSQLQQLQYGFKIALLITGTIPATLISNLIACTITKRNLLRPKMSCDSSFSDVKDGAALYLHVAAYLTAKEKPRNIPGLVLSNQI
jgi:hypothetical protein